MSERNMIEKLSNQDRNRDALFGVLHIKDKPYLHQRTAQHMFEESDSAVIVPLGTMESIWDERSGKSKRSVKIAILALLATGVLAILIHLVVLDPSFLIPFY